MSTTDTSVEVWWDVMMPFLNDTLGYQVLYTQTVVEDLDEWYKKEVPLTRSAELTGLDAKTMYTIRVAVFTNQGLGRLSEAITIRTEPTDVPLKLHTIDVTTHTMTLVWTPPKNFEPIRYRITYGAQKEFYDSQGFLQQLFTNSAPEFVESDTTQFKIIDYPKTRLIPFTTYHVNVTAVPSDESYRPPSRISVTTAMTRPKSMAKPYSIESENKQQITFILPHASEEYGIISHYFVAVVPKDFVNKVPDEYTIEELNLTPIDSIGPYIAAKWLRRTIPFMFSLGDGQTYNGFVNRRLVNGVSYQIFIRAVVDTPYCVFKSSPFSDIVCLPVLESTTIGDRSESEPTVARTDKYEINATAINASTVLVEWKASIYKQEPIAWSKRFRIQVQELNANRDFINDHILRYDVTDSMAEEYYISGLQPDTEYSIQLLAVTRGGDGSRSVSITVRTFGATNVESSDITPIIDIFLLILILLNGTQVLFVFSL